MRITRMKMGSIFYPDMLDFQREARIDDLPIQSIRARYRSSGTTSGLGADILGDPLEALAWLANHRASIGKPLRDGSFVMLGSVVQTVFFDTPASVMVDLAGLSQAEVQFT